MVKNVFFWNNSISIDIWILRKEQNLFRSDFFCSLYGDQYLLILNDKFYFNKLWNVLTFGQRPVIRNQNKIKWNWKSVIKHVFNPHVTWTDTPVFIPDFYQDVMGFRKMCIIFVYLWLLCDTEWCTIIKHSSAFSPC